MGEAKFTPGPWEWQIETIDRGAKKGAPIRERLWTGRPGSGSIVHASWNEFDGALWQTWVAVSDANAALIAAAPDLYEALREAVAYSEASSGLSGIPGAPIAEVAVTVENGRRFAFNVERARAALAKACPTPPVAATDNEGGER